jgi:hypothetical protein
MQEFRAANEVLEPDFDKRAVAEGWIDPRDRAYIVNVGPFEWRDIYPNFGYVEILKSPGKGQYMLTPVYGRKENFDIGDDRRGERTYSARTLAESFCHYGSEGTDTRDRGAFVSDSATPSADELRGALARMEKYFMERVNTADTIYGRAPNRPELISDEARTAAHWLGVDRPWLFKIEPTEDCPVCGERLKAGVAMCRNCGAILDADKATAFGVGGATGPGPDAPTAAVAAELPLEDDGTQPEPPQSAAKSKKQAKKRQ